MHAGQVIDAAVHFSVHSRKFYTEPIFVLLSTNILNRDNNVLNDLQTLRIIGISIKSCQNTNKVHM